MNTKRWKAPVTEAVNRATEIAKERGNPEVAPLHLMASLLVPDDGRVATLLRILARDLGAFRGCIDDALDDLPSERRLTMDPAPNTALRETMKLADTEREVLDEEELDEGHVFVALMAADGGLDRKLRKELAIKRSAIIDALRDEGKAAKQFAPVGDAPPGSPASLLQYCGDLTGTARSGELDPVIGRRAETAQLVEALARRRKNNAVLVGEPGVGKTAVVEGLALAITQERVPSILAGTQILTLDLAALVAGAKYKGEFEERFKKLIRELEGTAGQTILFIDEMHTLLQAGGGGGGIDAANLLKPALARGTLRVIGATTIAEYREHIERDRAFARRFVKIDIAEPDDSTCRDILRGVRPRYEEHHGVQVADEALDEAVRLSRRYVPDRFLPDKAIDLLDECCANTKIFVEGLAQLGGFAPDGEEEEPERHWVELLETVRSGLQARGVSGVPESAEGQDLAVFDESRKEVLELGQGVSGEVDAVQVGARVSLQTGIPIQKMMGKERERFARIEEHLHERLIGQDRAVAAVADAIRKGRAGLKRPNEPVGKFVFLGPTGTGKTELAKALAEFLFADERSMIRFDMSEFQQEHTVQRFIGAPPGFVGFGEGGQLTEPVRRRPYCVLLFDEIEKAHPKVFDVFLQVLDDGRLTDGQGRTVDFSNTVVIMTSNLASLWIAEQQEKGGDIDQKDLREKLIAGGRGLRPEFVNRFDELIIFDTLTAEQIRLILGLQLKGVRRMLDQKKLKIEISDAAMDQLAEHSYDPAMGARPVRRCIDRMILSPLARELVSAEPPEGSTVHVEFADDRVQIRLATPD